MKKNNNFFKLQKKGFVKIKNVLDAKEINKLKKIITLQKNSKKPGIFWAPHYYDPIYLKILQKNSIKSILIPALNDPFYNSIPSDKPNYILGEYIAIKNIGKKLHLHLDSWIPSSSKRTFMVQVVFLLDDRKKKNGCTVVIKNSHRSDEFSDRKRTDYTYLEGKKGDVIIWDSRLWHGRNEGIADNTWTLIATVQSWFIKQRFDYANYMPSKLLKKLNIQDKQLLGMCSVSPKSHKESLYIRSGYEILK